MGLWIKMKPEYGDQTEGLDLLILGAYYGEGKGFRAQGLSTFLLGARDDNSDLYHTIGKVGTGYSFDDLLALRKELATISKPWPPGGPAHLKHWKVSKQDTPHVYIPPEKSIVVELKCAELVRSTTFSACMTFRFPRITAIRRDKPYTDILSVDDLQRVRQQPRKTAAQAAGDGEGEDYPGGRKRGRGGRTGPALRTRGFQVDSQYRVGAAPTEMQGEFFQGRTYCVMGTQFQVIMGGVQRTCDRND
ncbi:hypothetical protein B484DRAFT_440908, partial [Ochromonadaceae sp. CCMP2298]